MKTKNILVKTSAIFLDKKKLCTVRTITKHKYMTFLASRKKKDKKYYCLCFSERFWFDFITNCSWSYQSKSVRGRNTKSKLSYNTLLKLYCVNHVFSMYVMYASCGAYIC